MQADHDAIPGWHAPEANNPRSPLLRGLWWLLTTVAIGFGVVAAIVLIVSGLF